MSARLVRPITFAYGNLVFGRTLDDAWAVFRLDTQSYPGLSRSRKLELLAQLAGFAYAVDSDFQILRVSRAWSLDDHIGAMRAGVGAHGGHPGRLARHLERERSMLAGRALRQTEVFLSVRIAAPRSPRELIAGRTELIRRVRRTLGFDDPRSISGRQLESLVAAEARLFGRVADYLDSRRATTSELRWLIRRTFSRGLGEPRADGSHEPQALVVEAPDEDGGARFVPLELDVLRLCEEPINVERRGLRVESELGDSFQTMLTLGALPETAVFPGPASELLFAPLDALAFPVDACVSARHVGNERAVALVRRRVIDADNVYREESHGDHGPSAAAAQRPQAARELQHYLSGPERPPLLCCSISLCVAAGEREALEERVERVRAEYGSLRLHRPLGEQLRLFVSHLPAQLSSVRDYDDYLVVEQLGAMVPTATHAVGSDEGPYIGHTLSGSRGPVLLDLREAPRDARPPAILCSGAPGSGKTVAAQLLAYSAFMLGSQVVDLDPKGDHRLVDLCGEELVERAVLTPDERYRGMLDPLRIGAPDTRGELAFNFLVEILPAPVPPAWQTELRLAVDATVAAGGRTCGEVVERLRGGNGDACDAARALTVHANGGLLRLGFARRHDEPARAGRRQLTSITIANLTLPDPRTARTEYSTEERTGSALLHLLAAYALALMGAEPERHKVLLFDEAWLLLGSPAGRALLQRINRLGRSQNATPILATQMLADAADLDGLIGALLTFGVESEQEARHALRLLRLDPDDERLRDELTAYRRGRCFLRDFRGRVGAIQVEAGDPDLLAALDTTPTAERLPLDAARDGTGGELPAS